MKDNATTDTFRIVSDIEDDVQAVLDYSRILITMAEGPAEDGAYATALNRVALNIKHHAEIIEEARGALFHALNPYGQAVE